MTLLAIFWLVPSEIDQSRFHPLEGNFSLYVLMILLAWTTIAFGGELFYQVFLISRLVDQASMCKTLAITISSIILGFVHCAEGSMGILSNGCFGAFFGWIYIQSKRNFGLHFLAMGSSIH